MSAKVTNTVHEDELNSNKSRMVSLTDTVATSTVTVDVLFRHPRTRCGVVVNTLCNHHVNFGSQVAVEGSTPQWRMTSSKQTIPEHGIAL